MKHSWQIQTSKCAKQVNSVGQSSRIQSKQVVYLVSIKPLLQPELALPAEEEDELDHDDEEADGPGPGSGPGPPSTPLKLNLPPTSCLCRLTPQASLPLNGYEIAISIHKRNLSLNGECVFQSNLEHLLCSGGAMAYGCRGEENIWWCGCRGRVDDGEAARASRGGRRQLSTTGLGGSRSSCTTGSYLPPPKLSIKSDKCEENGSRKDKGLLYWK